MSDLQLELSTSLAPAPHFILALCELARPDRRYPPAPWAEQLRPLVPPAMLEDLSLIAVLRDLLLNDDESLTVPEFLAGLAAMEPAHWRDSLLARLAADTEHDAPTLLAQRKALRDALALRFPDQPAPDPAALTRLHAGLSDPAQLLAAIVALLDTAYEAYWLPEWPALSAVLKFRVALLSALPPLAAPEAILASLPAPALPLPPLAGLERMVLVPTPLIPGRTLCWRGPRTLWCFSAPENAAAGAYSRPLSRVDLAAQLRTLGSEAALALLAATNDGAEHPEADLLALTEPTTLQELVAHGFLRVRHLDETTALYRAVPTRIAAAYAELAKHLSGQAPPPEPAPANGREIPADLRRFINQDGRMVIWPAKYQVRLKILAFLCELFEPGRDYTEREIKALLAPHTGIDHVNLRRMLCDEGFLERDSRGTVYRRVCL